VLILKAEHLNQHNVCVLYNSEWRHDFTEPEPNLNHTLNTAILKVSIMKKFKQNYQIQVQIRLVRNYKIQIQSKSIKKLQIRRIYIQIHVHL